MLHASCPDQPTLMGRLCNNYNTLMSGGRPSKLVPQEDWQYEGLRVQLGVAGCGFMCINKGCFLVCTDLGRLNGEPAGLLFFFFFFASRALKGTLIGIPAEN